MCDTSPKIFPADPELARRILRLVQSSFLDGSYQTEQYWTVASIQKIKSPHLERTYWEKKRYLELQNRTQIELQDKWLFTCYKNNELLVTIPIYGLTVQESRFNFLGDSLKGVILCKHADIQLKAAERDGQPRCWLMLFKVVYGRTVTVDPMVDIIRSPTAGADCHVSVTTPSVMESLGCQARKSQVYLFEVDPMSDTGYSKKPRQCLPEAYVEFVSRSAFEMAMTRTLSYPLQQQQQQYLQQQQHLQLQQQQLQQQIQQQQHIKQQQQMQIHQNQLQQQLQQQHTRQLQQEAAQSNKKANPRRRKAQGERRQPPPSSTLASAAAAAASAVTASATQQMMNQNIPAPQNTWNQKQYLQNYYGESSSAPAKSASYQYHATPSYYRDNSQGYRPNHGQSPMDCRQVRPNINQNTMHINRVPTNCGPAQSNVNQIQSMYGRGSNMSNYVDPPPPYPGTYELNIVEQHLDEITSLFLAAVQLFAKEMNMIIALWREANVSVSNTPLAEAAKSLEELRHKFGEITRVYYEFGRTKEILDGRMTSLPNLADLIRREAWIKECQAFMLQAFQGCQLARSQELEVVQKALITAREVLQNKSLLLNCLVVLDGALTGIFPNAIPASDPSSTMDARIQNSNYGLTSSNAFSIRQPQQPSPHLIPQTTVPSHERVFNPRQGSASLASLEALIAASNVPLDMNFMMGAVQGALDLTTANMSARSSYNFSSENQLESATGLESTTGDSYVGDDASEFSTRKPIVIQPDDGSDHDDDPLPRMPSVKTELAKLPRQRNNPSDIIVIDADDFEIPKELPWCRKVKLERPVMIDLPLQSTDDTSGMIPLSEPLENDDLDFIASVCSLPAETPVVMPADGSVPLDVPNNQVEPSDISDEPVSTGQAQSFPPSDLDSMITVELNVSDGVNFVFDNDVSAGEVVSQRNFKSVQGEQEQESSLDPNVVNEKQKFYSNKRRLVGDRKLKQRKPFSFVKRNWCWFAAESKKHEKYQQSREECQTRIDRSDELSYEIILQESGVVSENVGQVSCITEDDRFTEQQLNENECEFENTFESILPIDKCSNPLLESLLNDVTMANENEKKCNSENSTVLHESDLSGVPQTTLDGSDFSVAIKTIDDGNLTEIPKFSEDENADNLFPSVICESSLQNVESEKKSNSLAAFDSIGNNPSDCSQEPLPVTETSSNVQFFWTDDTEDASFLQIRIENVYSLGELNETEDVVSVNIQQAVEDSSPEKHNDTVQHSEAMSSSISVTIANRSSQIVNQASLVEEMAACTEETEDLVLPAYETVRMSETMKLYSDIFATCKEVQISGSFSLPQSDRAVETVAGGVSTEELLAIEGEMAPPQEPLSPGVAPEESVAPEDQASELVAPEKLLILEQLAPEVLTPEEMEQTECDSPRASSLHSVEESLCVHDTVPSSRSESFSDVPSTDGCSPTENVNMQQTVARSEPISDDEDIDVETDDVRGEVSNNLNNETPAQNVLNTSTDFLEDLNDSDIEIEIETEDEIQANREEPLSTTDDPALKPSLDLPYACQPSRALPSFVDMEELKEFSSANIVGKTESESKSETQSHMFLSKSFGSSEVMEDLKKSSTSDELLLSKIPRIDPREEFYTMYSDDDDNDEFVNDSPLIETTFEPFSNMAIEASSNIKVNQLNSSEIEPSNPVPVELSTDPGPLELPTDLVPVELLTDPLPVELSTDPVQVELSSDPLPVDLSTDPVPVELSTDPVPVKLSTDPVPVELSTYPLPVELSTDPVPFKLSTDPLPVELSTDPVPIELSTAVVQQKKYKRKPGAREYRTRKRSRRGKKQKKPKKGAKSEQYTCNDNVVEREKGSIHSLETAGTVMDGFHFENMSKSTGSDEILDSTIHGSNGSNVSLKSTLVKSPQPVTKKRRRKKNLIYDHGCENTRFTVKSGVYYFSEDYRDLNWKSSRKNVSANASDLSNFEDVSFECKLGNESGKRKISGQGKKQRDGLKLTIQKTKSKKLTDKLQKTDDYEILGDGEGNNITSTKSIDSDKDGTRSDELDSSVQNLVVKKKKVGRPRKVTVDSSEMLRLNPDIENTSTPVSSLMHTEVEKKKTKKRKRESECSAENKTDQTSRETNNDENNSSLEKYSNVDEQDSSMASRRRRRKRKPNYVTVDIDSRNENDNDSPALPLCAQNRRKAARERVDALYKEYEITMPGSRRVSKSKREIFDIKSPDVPSSVEQEQYNFSRFSTTAVHRDNLFTAVANSVPSDITDEIPGNFSDEISPAIPEILNDVLFLEKIKAAIGTSEKSKTQNSDSSKIVNESETDSNTNSPSKHSRPIFYTGILSGTSRIDLAKSWDTSVEAKELNCSSHLPLQTNSNCTLGKIQETDAQTEQSQTLETGFIQSVDTKLNQANDAVLTEPAVVSSSSAVSSQIVQKIKPAGNVRNDPTYNHTPAYYTGIAGPALVKCMQQESNRPAPVGLPIPTITSSSRDPRLNPNRHRHNVGEPEMEHMFGNKYFSNRNENETPVYRSVVLPPPLQPTPTPLSNDLGTKLDRIASPVASEPSDSSKSRNQVERLKPSEYFKRYNRTLSDTSENILSSINPGMSPRNDSTASQSRNIIDEIHSPSPSFGDNQKREESLKESKSECNRFKPYPTKGNLNIRKPLSVRDKFWLRYFKPIDGLPDRPPIHFGRLFLSERMSIEDPKDPRLDSSRQSHYSSSSTNTVDGVAMVIDLPESTINARRFYGEAPSRASNIAIEVLQDKIKRCTHPEKIVERNTADDRMQKNVAFGLVNDSNRKVKFLNVAKNDSFDKARPVEVTKETTPRINFQFDRAGLNENKKDERFGIDNKQIVSGKFNKESSVLHKKDIVGNCKKTEKKSTEKPLKPEKQKGCQSSAELMSRKPYSSSASKVIEESRDSSTDSTKQKRDIKVLLVRCDGQQIGDDDSINKHRPDSVEHKKPVSNHKTKDLKESHAQKRHHSSSKKNSDSDTKLPTRLPVGLKKSTDKSDDKGKTKSSTARVEFCKLSDKSKDITDHSKNSDIVVNSSVCQSQKLDEKTTQKKSSKSSKKNFDNSSYHKEKDSKMKQDKPRLKIASHENQADITTKSKDNKNKDKPSCDSDSKKKINACSVSHKKKNERESLETGENVVIAADNSKETDGGIEELKNVQASKNTLNINAGISKSETGVTSKVSVKSTVEILRSEKVSVIKDSEESDSIPQKSEVALTSQVAEESVDKNQKSGNVPSSKNSGKSIVVIKSSSFQVIGDVRSEILKSIKNRKSNLEEKLKSGADSTIDFLNSEMEVEEQPSTEPVLMVPANSISTSSSTTVPVPTNSISDSSSTTVPVRTVPSNSISDSSSTTIPVPTVTTNSISSSSTVPVPTVQTSPNNHEQTSTGFKSFVVENQTEAVQGMAELSETIDRICEQASTGNERSVAENETAAVQVMAVELCETVVDSEKDKDPTMFTQSNVSDENSCVTETLNPTQSGVESLQSGELQSAPELKTLDDVAAADFTADAGKIMNTGDAGEVLLEGDGSESEYPVKKSEIENRKDEENKLLKSNLPIGASSDNIGERPMKNQCTIVKLACSAEESILEGDGSESENVGDKSKMESSETGVKKKPTSSNVHPLGRGMKRTASPLELSANTAKKSRMSLRSSITQKDVDNLEKVEPTNVVTASPQKHQTPKKLAALSQWQSICSNWTEMSRDADEPSVNSEEGNTITQTCMKMLSEVPASEMSMLKSRYSGELKLIEQKIMEEATYTDPIKSLSESQIRKMLNQTVGSASVERELRAELEILDLEKRLAAAECSMEDLKNKLDVSKPCTLLDDELHLEERKYNLLLVQKDMHHRQMNEIKRFQKSNFVHVIPDVFLLVDEIGKHISSEGMLLFLQEPTLAVDFCTRLSALKQAIENTTDELTKVDSRLKGSDEVRIKLGWFHNQRKLLLQEICCTTVGRKKRLMNDLADKLSWYQDVEADIVKRSDRRGQPLQQFVKSTKEMLQKFLSILNAAFKFKDGLWKIDTEETEKEQPTDVRTENSGSSRWENPTVRSSQRFNADYRDKMKQWQKSRWSPSMSSWDGRYHSRRDSGSSSRWMEYKEGSPHRTGETSSVASSEDQPGCKYNTCPYSY